MDAFKEINKNTISFFIGFGIGSIIDKAFYEIVDKWVENNKRSIDPYLKFKVSVTFYLQIVVFYLVSYLVRNSKLGQAWIGVGLKRGMWTAFIFSIAYYRDFYVDLIDYLV